MPTRRPDKKKKLRRSSGRRRSFDTVGDYLNFAALLASEGRNAEAREWAQKVLDKKPTMPDLPAPPGAAVVPACARDAEALPGKAL